MHGKTRFLALALLIFVAAFGANSQQSAQEEFMSVLGRFGIMLPPNYAEFKTNLDITIGENKFHGAMYRWALASNQAARVFREMRRYPNIVLASNSKDKKDQISKAPDPEPKDFKVKYKHGRDGKLLEMRSVRDDGKELESIIYNLKNKTVEHTFDSAYGTFGGDFNFEHNKMVSTLDSNGHSIEDAYRIRDGALYIPRSVRGESVRMYEPRYRTEKVKHEYELDDRGNWIKRTTFNFKNKVPVPSSVTYRTITYYE